MAGDLKAWVVAVCAAAAHSFSKPQQHSITLVEGLGVEGDAHAGKLVMHRSRISQNPRPANLRQVHLIHSELFDELAAQGFTVRPGDLGENITTRGIDLLALPTGTKLAIGTAEIEITGLRNPCRQLNDFQSGLTAAVLDRAEDGSLIRKAGVMGIVVKGGAVSAESEIRMTLPAAPHRPLQPV